MKAIDTYIKEVIQKGDDMSSQLEKNFSQTLKNSPYVDVVTQGMHGIKVIRPPQDCLTVVYSANGDPSLSDPRAYAYSVVDKLIHTAEDMHATPVAFTNVIDAQSGNKEVILPFAEALAERAHAFKLAVPNGEFAVLGDRLTVPANISATMLGFLPKKDISKVLESRSYDDEYTSFEINRIQCVVFDPEGKAVYMNSDGVGTKTEFYEREGNYWKAENDSIAMKLDDLVKIGATAKVVSDVWETNTNGLSKMKNSGGGTFFSDVNIVYIMQKEDMGNRLLPYQEGQAVFNVSGSAVSTIDEERLKNPLAPQAGDFLVAMRGEPNPRSNGITDKRKIMIELFGSDWHNTQTGRIFMEYLSQPSVIFYRVFKQLIEKGLATSVYHMSGGAFDGKLARPLAKQNLFVRMENLFPPDWRELALVGARFTPAETAYRKWPMGNDGFVTTSKPEETIKEITSQYWSTLNKSAFHPRLEARIVGQLEKANNGNAGIEFSPYQGNPIHFPGDLKLIW